MRIDEFQQTSALLVRDLVTGLKQKMHLTQLGGAARVYDVNGKMGVIYLINRSPRALGVVIDPQQGRVERVCLWHKVDPDHSPDMECVIPPEATVQNCLDQVINFVIHERIVEAVEFQRDDEVEVQIVLRRGGEAFRIPGMNKMEQRFEQMVRETIKSGADDSRSMEEQYRVLEGKVKLVAASRGSFVKSLLITGAPSTGKTFRVMQTIKSLGLQSGADYITKKGKISAKALYRVLIEQLHGLAIFDDCDSVVEDPNGVNMLKGALDTDPVRTVDYDVQGSLNTGAMSFRRRGQIVSAMSSILRGTASNEELSTIEDLMPAKERVKSSSGVDEDEPEFYTDEDGDLAIRQKENSNNERQVACESWVMRNLPNKIDYEGRIIFISNMSQEEWDSAIITRAFHQDMQFGSAEMLDFIRTIQASIPANKLSEADKTEVLDYIEQRFKAGQITSQINFRFVMKCFDFYIMKQDGFDWKMLINDIP